MPFWFSNQCKRMTNSSPKYDYFQCKRMPNSSPKYDSWEQTKEKWTNVVLTMEILSTSRNFNRSWRQTFNKRANLEATPRIRDWIGKYRVPVFDPSHKESIHYQCMYDSTFGNWKEHILSRERECVTIIHQIFISFKILKE